MLTAAPCQPLPGPLGAAWPTAQPGIEYCGPYPACCPPAAEPWWQNLLGLLNPHGDWSLIALEAVWAVLYLALIVAVFCARAQRRRRERATAQRHRWEQERDWLR
jgi:hypothetical protein